MAKREVGAEVVVAAAGKALKVVVAGVLEHFLPVQAHRRVCTRKRGAAKGGVDAF